MTNNGRETRTLQCWPGGASYEYQGDIDGPAEQKRLRKGYDRDARWRKGTAEEWRQIRIEVRAEMYRDRDVLCCDSSLVDDLLKLHGECRGELADAFAYEEIQNLYADPSDWDLDKCKEYCDDNGIDAPDDVNPWTMDRAALAELLEGVSIEVRDDETIDVLRKAVIVNMDDETIDGLDVWRDACRDFSQDNPAEVYEWWRVSQWLCDQLKGIGEVVIDNGYGCWWGRCGTGQQYIMDGVLQRVAAQFEREP